MKKITIAVGSKRGPKLSAVTEALQSFSATLAHDAEFEVVGVEVESGVGHTPASRDELMRGRHLFQSRTRSPFTPHLFPFTLGREAEQKET